MRRALNNPEECFGVYPCALRIGELPDSSFMATRVGSVRRVICTSPAYLAAHGTLAEPADLARHRCITFEVPASGR